MRTGSVLPVWQEEEEEEEEGLLTNECRSVGTTRSHVALEEEEEEESEEDKDAEPQLWGVPVRSRNINRETLWQRGFTPHRLVL